MDLSRDLKAHKNGLMLFGSVLFSDQISKILFYDFKWEFFSSILMLKSLVNPGIIFGNLASVDPVLRIIFFSTLFTLILFVGILIKLYFLSSLRYQRMTYGLSLFLAGISGNGIDRIRLGAAIDFINLRLPVFEHYSFNLADVFQIIGFVILVYYLFKDGDSLFPEDSQRRFNLIEPKYQLSFALKFSLISFFSMLVTGTFSYVFMKVYVPSFHSQIQNTFLLTWIFLGCLLTLMSFMFGLILSKRKIGPIFALKRFVNDIKEGKEGNLKLREMDSFKELEEISKDINDLIRK